MADAGMRIKFEVTGNAGKTIAQLKKEVAELRKRFHDAEEGTKDFIKAGEKLYSFEKDLKSVTNAVKNQRREMYETQKSVESLARAYKKAGEAQQRAIANFRMGMGAKGAIPDVASPIRGTVGQAGSPANRAFVGARRSGPLIDPGSMRALEIKIDSLKDKAARIKPDTEAWKRLQRNLRQSEEAMTRMEKKRIPRTGRAMGMAKGAAGALGRGAAGLGASALAGGGPGTMLGSGIGMAIGGPMGGFVGAGVGQAVDQLGAMAAKSVEAFNAVERMKRGLAMASIDAADFANSNQLVEESSKRLLMPLEKTYKHFAQLRVNTKQFGMSAKDTQEILEGTALAVAATGGSMEDIDGAMRAVVQIFSKGTVQAEELRGQLGERFPGAVVKFAKANNMSMEQLQKALQKGEVGVEQFVNFAKQNFEDYEEFAEKMATAPEYAGRRAAIAMDQLNRDVGEAFAPLGSEVQQVFADMMSGLSDFVKENKESIDTFVRDLQIVIRRLADFGSFVADLAGKIAGFLAPAIDMMRELLGLKSGAEYRAQAAAMEPQIAQARLAVEQSSGGRDKDAKKRALKRLTTRQAGLITTAEGAEADKTQQDVDRTTGSVKGDKSYTFGGQGAGLSTTPVPKTPGGGAAGNKRKDMAMSVAAAEREVMRIKLAIARQDNTGNELTLMRAQYALDVANINARDMLTTERAVALEQAKNKLLIDEANFGRENGKKLAEELTKEIERRNQIKDVLDEAKFASGEMSDSERETAQFLRDQRDARAEFLKLKPTEEDIEAFERFQGKQRSQFAPSGSLKEYIEQADKQLKDVQGMARSAAEGIESSLGGAFSSIITGTESFREAMGNLFGNISKMFADMVAQMIAKWATMQLVKGLGSLFGGGAGVAPDAGDAMDGGGVLPMFANGGIVKGPTLGMVGEGRYNEAIVPLPNGKSIPVEMGKGAGGNVNSSVVVNISNEGSESRTKGDQGNQLAKGIEGAVKQVIMREMRPGGMIASRQ
nr:phage-related minor tail protein [uncultured Mediterranean phage uvMED]